MGEGSCQVKKNPKIREKLGSSRPHLPTRLSIFYFFLKHVPRQKQHTKNTIFPPKKKEIRGGAWHTHPLPSFSRIFLNFFNLTKPLRWNGGNCFELFSTEPAFSASTMSRGSLVPDIHASQGQNVCCIQTSGKRPGKMANGFDLSWTKTTMTNVGPLSTTLAQN